jgi:hypothetical protein
MWWSGCLAQPIHEAALRRFTRWLPKSLGAQTKDTGINRSRGVERSLSAFDPAPVFHE